MQVERKATVDVRRVRPEEYAAVGELTVAAYLHDGLLNADNGSAGHYTSLLRDTAARDGQAEVIWQDSAPGVPDAALPRLTDRLFRVDTSRSRAGGGSGLGLAIADAIVKAHDGSLHAQASRWAAYAGRCGYPPSKPGYADPRGTKSWLNAS